MLQNFIYEAIGEFIVANHIKVTDGHSWKFDMLQVGKHVMWLSGHSSQ